MQLQSNEARGGRWYLSINMEPELFYSEGNQENAADTIGA